MIPALVTEVPSLKVAVQRCPADPSAANMATSSTAQKLCCILTGQLTGQEDDRAPQRPVTRASRQGWQLRHRVCRRPTVPSRAPRAQALIAATVAYA